MAAVNRIADYICIRENFSFNKHFVPGDEFPQLWVEKGYKPNQHFASAKTAASELERARTEVAQYGHGDDPRSTQELRNILSAYMETIPEDWTRKRIWIEVYRRKNAENKDSQKPKKAK